MHLPRQVIELVIRSRVFFYRLCQQRSFEYELHEVKDVNEVDENEVHESSVPHFDMDVM